MTREKEREEIAILCGGCLSADQLPQPSNCWLLADSENLKWAKGVELKCST